MGDSLRWPSEPASHWHDSGRLIFRHMADMAIESVESIEPNLASSRSAIKVNVLTASGDGLLAMREASQLCRIVPHHNDRMAWHPYFWNLLQPSTSCLHCFAAAAVFELCGVLHLHQWMPSSSEQNYWLATSSNTSKIFKFTKWIKDWVWCEVPGVISLWSFIATCSESDWIRCQPPTGSSGPVHAADITGA